MLSTRVERSGSRSKSALKTHDVTPCGAPVGISRKRNCHLIYPFWLSQQYLAISTLSNITSDDPSPAPDGDSRNIMHIPLVKLAPWLVPLLSPDRETARPSSHSQASGSTSLTFQPIHAIGHTTSNTSSPQVVFNNGSSVDAFTNSANFHALSDREQEAYLLDHPNPEIAAQPLSIRTKLITIRRPRIRPPSIISWALSAQSQRKLYSFRSDEEREGGIWIAPEYDDHHGWEDVEVVAPDVSDRQTLITMAKMASNAYVLPDGGEWWPLSDWNATGPFGWEPDADGLRGHVVGQLDESRLMKVCRCHEFDSGRGDQGHVGRVARIWRSDVKERQVQCGS